jgi:hypothetical protein
MCGDYAQSAIIILPEVFTIYGEVLSESVMIIQSEICPVPTAPVFGDNSIVHCG